MQSNTSDHDTMQLVQQAQRGNREAFEQLVQTHRAMVMATVRSHVASPVDAEDLTQEVLLKAYLHLGKLRQPTSFRHWLRRLAQNQCRDWHRRHGEFTVPLDSNEIASAPSAEEHMLRQELRLLVHEAMNVLQEVDRALLKARYLEDAGYPELQAVHGLSYAAVVNRLKRARSRVRERVQSLLGGIVWTPVGKKLLTGGTGAMKLGMKIKVTVGGMAGILALSGSIVWYASQSLSTEERLTQLQRVRETSSATGLDMQPRVRQGSGNLNETPNLLHTQQQLSQLVAPTTLSPDARGIDELSKNVEPTKSNIKATETLHTEDDKPQEIDYGPQIEVVSQQITALILQVGEVNRRKAELATLSHERIDPYEVERLTIARRETGQATMRAIMDYKRLTGDLDSTRPGGWIYELGRKHGFHISHGS